MKVALTSLLVFATLLLSAQAFAFKLSPMIASFAPSGSAATQNFTLENTGSEKISVEIEALHRFMDLDGKETRTPTDEFSVYPQTLTLSPHEKHTIRVSWTGNRAPDRELNYRLVVSEIPLGHAKSSGVEFLMQYVASLYVTPEASQPKVSVESFKVLSDGRGELVLKNSGLAHRMLKEMKIILKAGMQTRAEIDAEKSDELQSENILSLSSRRFFLPLPQSAVKAEKAQPGSVKAEITL